MLKVPLICRSMCLVMWLHKEVEFGRRLDRVGHYHRFWCCDQWLVEAPTRLLPLLLQLFRWKSNVAEGCPTSRTPWSLTVRPLKTYRLNPNLLEAAGSSAPTIHCSRWDWESIFGKKNWQKKTLNSRHIIIKSIFIKPHHFFSHRFEKGFLLCKYDIKIIHEFILNTIFVFFLHTLGPAPKGCKTSGFHAVEQTGSWIIKMRIHYLPSVWTRVLATPNQQ